MKNATLRFLVSAICLTFALNAPAQCYVRLEDASGFNTDPYQAGLEAAASKLCAIFDTTGFAGQFKVYDFGFYLHQEHTSGGYPEPFAQKVAQVQALSPYYLLFGKQTDKSGIYTRFWVDLVLPDQGNFSCLSNIQKDIILELIKGAVNTKYNENNRAYYAYFTAEITGMDILNKEIVYAAECCFSRSTNCTNWALLHESFTRLS